MTKYIIIRYSVNNGYITKDIEAVSTTYKDAGRAIEDMKKIVLGEIENILANGNDFRVVNTSSERYVDAWGYTNNGVLIVNNGEQYQHEVIEANDYTDIKRNLYKLYQQ